MTYQPIPAQADGTTRVGVRGIVIQGDDGTNVQNVHTDTDGDLQVDVLTMPAVTVSGSVTANAGTNLNTSLLALEAGGNLAGINTKLDIVDDWDESDRAKVNPIVGQAGVQGASGVVTALTQRVVLATDVALPAGTNAIGKLAANSGVDIGDVDVTSYPIQTNRVASGALGALDAAITLSAQGLASITFEIPIGTLLTTTVAFEATLDDSTWFAVNAMGVSGSGTGSLLLTSTATFPVRGMVLVAGWSQFRLRVSTYGSGTTTAYVEGSAATSAISVYGVFPGNSANALGKNEDSAHTSSDIGVMALCVAKNLASPADTVSAAGDYSGLSTDLEGNPTIVGNRNHDAADAGPPVKIGMKAINHGTTPTAVAASDRTDWYANRHGIPWVLGGHPNLQSIEYNITTSNTDASPKTLIAGSANVRIVVTMIDVMLDKDTTATGVQVRIGFATSALTAVSTSGIAGIILSHPDLAAGSGVVKGSGAGMVGFSAAGDALLMANDTVTGGNLRITIHYYTITEA